MSQPMSDPEDTTPSRSDPDPASPSAAGSKPKRFCSAEQREINRKSASFSTGPRTVASKNISKFNGITHGMCCEEPVVLEGEDGALLQAKIGLWIFELGAVTDAERTEVENAMQSQWRVQRCRKDDTEATDRARDEFNDGFYERMTDEVETLVPQLPADPPAIRGRLEDCSEGLRHLISEFEFLELQLNDVGCLEPGQRIRAIQLSGKRPTDIFTDPLVTYIDRLHLAARYYPDKLDGARVAEMLAKDRPEAVGPREFERRLDLECQTLPDREEATELLKQFVAENLELLKERLELIKLREERDRRRMRNELMIDATPAGRHRLRYELSHLRAKDASLRQFRLLREARLKEEAAQAGTAPQGQPQPPADPAGDEAPAEAANVVNGLNRNDVSSDPVEGNVAAPEPSNGGAAVPTAAEATAVPTAASPAEVQAVAPPGAGPEGLGVKQTGTARVSCPAGCHVELPAPEGGTVEVPVAGVGRPVPDG